MASSFSDDEIKPGDPVMFTTYVQGKALTRTYADETAFNTDMATYHDASSSYAFTYEIYKSGEGPAIASGSTVYWPDNVNAYGFKATAGSDAVATDQTTDANLLLQDKLIGYGFEPLWSEDAPVDIIEGLNYRTCGNWKAANISRGVPEADQKKIPLYLKHQRSKITIILKEGEGMNHEDLALSTAGTNIDATIYSYSGESTTPVKPYASETTISTVTYTQYTAIVEPYDYQTNSEKVIARISVSGQPFTFSVNNESDNEKKSNYNLTAGKHLIITATLARGDAQKVLLTAQIVPWDEITTDATVRDDGLVGSTTDIDSRAGLLAFLSGENNKAGNIANITADIDLESGEAWTSQPLNCTMKLNNHTISTTHPVFTTIGALGKVEGGTISVSGDATEVTAAVATTNLGTIKEVTVSRSSTGKASQGGLVVTNSGTISNCTSYLPVHGTSGVVGGIAKESVYSTIGSMPVIENCTVDTRVDGETISYGGGIVGWAVGRVSGNTFEYGITILQNTTNFKNIVWGKYDETPELRAYNNTWPTNADNTIGDDTNHNANKTTEDNRFNATIDSQAELAEILNGTNNLAGRKYRLSDNFVVTETALGGEGWTNDYSGIAATFWLDGNNKNIITDPTTLILFGEIGTHTTNLKVNGNLVSTP